MPLCTQWQSDSGIVKARVAGLILDFDRDRNVYERLGISLLNDDHAGALGSLPGAKQSRFAGAGLMQSIVLI